jgi:hypothetical protein
MFRGSKTVIFATLILLGSFFLELKQKTAFGWSFDYILVALLVIPLFLDFFEFVFFGAVAFMLLKLVYPWSGPEVILLITLPVLVFIFKKIFPWQSWLEPFSAVLMGVTGFYSIINPAAFFGNLRFLLPDIALSMIFGWAIYYFLESTGKGKFK